MSERAGGRARTQVSERAGGCTRTARRRSAPPPGHSAHASQAEVCGCVVCMCVCVMLGRAHLWVGHCKVVRVDATLSANPCVARA
eukprot:737937-Prymnesium_polylepis.1